MYFNFNFPFIPFKPSRDDGHKSPSDQVRAMSDDKEEPAVPHVNVEEIEAQFEVMDKERCEQILTRMISRQVVIKVKKLEKNLKLFQTVFKCKKCPKFYAFYSQLQRHQKRMHTIKKFPCGSCDKTFQRQQTLSLHVELKHPSGRIEAKTYSCKKCPLSFTFKSNLQHHVAVQHKAAKKVESNPTGRGDFQCKFCNKNYNFERSLQYHVDVTHEPAEGSVRKFHCNKCPRSFDFNSVFVRHAQSHLSSPARIKRRPKRKLYSGGSSEKINWISKDGGKHRQIKLQHELKASKRKVLRRCSDDDELKTFPCRLCDQTFSFQISLNKHIDRAHQSEVKKEFKCRNCTRSFDFQINLDRHYKCQHSLGPIVKKVVRPRQLSCKFCGIEYFTESGVKRHEDFSHPQLSNVAKKFDCINCSRSFNFKENLSRHEQQCALSDPEMRTESIETRRLSVRLAIKQDARDEGEGSIWEEMM